jgi:hypothetical protein
MFSGQTGEMLLGVLGGSVGSNFILATARKNNWGGSKTLWGGIFWKAGVSAAASYFLWRKQPTIARAVLVGGAVSIVSDIVTSSTTSPFKPYFNSMPRGTGKYLGRRGTGAFIAGVPTLLTGPASAAIALNARRGVGAYAGRPRLGAPLRSPFNPLTTAVPQARMRRGVGGMISGKFATNAPTYGNDPFVKR